MTKRFLGEGETKPVYATLYVIDRAGGRVPVSGKASIVTAASGSVKFEPAASDFRAAGSPYAVTWTVTDSNSDEAWYPNKEPEWWIVRAN
jgi:hypothetical protein